MIDLDKIANRLTHYKHMKKLLEANETRTALIAMRKKLYDSQKQSNYMNEYNRLRGELSKSVLRGETKARLEHRKKTLESLGAIAMDRIV